MRGDARTYVWYTLRAGAAMCFIGHGVFGLLGKEAWLPFFWFWGIEADTARVLMPVVGTVDIVVGVLAIVSPRPVVFAWMAFWGILTAALRPLTGDAFAEFAERAGNYGVPLALLVMAWPGAQIRAWFAPATPHSGGEARPLVPVLVATTCVLLAGHGFIGLAGSQLLAGHYDSVGLNTALAPTIGIAEIIAAIVLALHPTALLAVGIMLWKLASESLFLSAGAPVWEFIERGGSYAAPLALAILLAARVRHARAARQAALTTLGAIVAATVVTTAARAQETDTAAATSQLSSPAQPSPRELLAMLRHGGVVLACRHATTEEGVTDSGADRSRQRNLSDAGREEAERLGAAIRRLNLPITDVLTSVMYRNRDSAELMFGSATQTPLLRMTPDSAATRRLFTTRPPPGQVRVLMTHTGVLARHFRGTPFQRVPEAGCVVVRPDGGSVPRPVALIREADWLAMR